MSGLLTIADVLERAADLIEPEGAWNGCYCVATAVWAAASGDPKGLRESIAIPAEEAFAQHVGLDAADLPYSIYRWNDAAERNAVEVVAKLREAAALAREQGK